MCPQISHTVKGNTCRSHVFKVRFCNNALNNLKAEILGNGLDLILKFSPL